MTDKTATATTRARLAEIVEQRYPFIRVSQSLRDAIEDEMGLECA